LGRYSPYLLLQYQGHLNVALEMHKYLYKYCCKGPGAVG